MASRARWNLTSVQHLGRAKDVSEFVKHGCREASIEIELAKDPGRHECNPVIRRHIRREGNKSHFTIDGQPSTVKSLAQLTQSFSIQIDNLCQFLPQDKVCEFAALSPVELLHETQRAAAAPHVLKWHVDLKTLRVEEKKCQTQQQTDKETLTNLDGRQQILQADVERLKERTTILERVDLLEQSRPFVDYRAARLLNAETKQRRKEVQAALRKLETEVEPSLHAVNAKQDYAQAVDKERAERRRAVDRAEARADVMLTKQKDVEERIAELRSEITSERNGDKDRRQDVVRLEGKMQNLRSQMNEEPLDFDPAAYNEQIREKTRAVREMHTTSSQLRESHADLLRHTKEKTQRISQAERDLEDLDSQAGQQGAKLRKISGDTAQAWDWIRSHQDVFEHPVFGPPVVECSIKNPDYVDAMESLFQRNDLLTFTTQCRNDYKLLSDQLYGKMRLAEITIRTTTSKVDSFRPPVSDELMRRFGFEGWARDYISGPEPVMAMLCSECRLHQTGVALQDISDQQYEMLQDSAIGSWVTGRASFQITRRREYGPGATSTRVRDYRKATVWTNQPVDVAAKRDLQESIQGWREEREHVQTRMYECRRQIDELRKEASLLDAEKKELEEEKMVKQKAVSEFKALPTKLGEHTGPSRLSELTRPQHRWSSNARRRKKPGRSARNACSSSTRGSMRESWRKRNSVLITR